MNMNRPEKIIDALRVISARIKSFNPEHENPEEISSSIDELEKISRKEYSKHYEKFLSDPSLAKKIVSLCRAESFDIKTIINTISTIGNMIKRYGLPPSDYLFDFFDETKHLKKANYYVSLFIMRFPQFRMRQDRLDYLASMPRISPRKNSERNFYVELKKIIDCRELIPDPEKRKLTLSLKNMIDKEENTFYKNEYKELLQKIIQ
ncbi:MAG: hypothetical protein ABN482_04915 [Corticimicrobacter sp.]|uniref:hypothetical protein n=1 Tax=Corticimicrobacter sp. TaxID=2678536 RepID=UPI0032DB2EE0